MPKTRLTRRWAQVSEIRLRRPLRSRNRTSDSPSRCTDCTGFSSNWVAAAMGCQYQRSRRPIGVSGPTWVKASFSSAVSIGRSSYGANYRVARLNTTESEINTLGVEYLGRDQGDPLVAFAAGAADAQRADHLAATQQGHGARREDDAPAVQRVDPDLHRIVAG